MEKKLQRRSCLKGALSIIAAAAAGFAPTLSRAAGPGKMIVVYFSWSGSTQAVAQEIERLTGCDIARIEAAVPYPKDYNDTVARNKTERDGGLFPEIKPLPDLSGYDIVAIGHPIWSGRMPRPLYTFLDRVDLSGKTIFHFSTSGGSGLGNSQEEISRLEPAAKLLPGRTVYGWGGVRDLSVVRGWLEKAGIPLK